MRQNLGLAQSSPWPQSAESCSVGFSVLFDWNDPNIRNKLLRVRPSVDFDFVYRVAAAAAAAAIRVVVFNEHIIDPCTHVRSRATDRNIFRRRK